MKHSFLFGLLLFVLSFSLSPKINVSFAEERLDLNGSNVVLMEQDSRRIIYSENPDAKLYPASMTKMMGLLLILDELEEEKITMKDMVTCSEYASSMGGTQIYLEPGEKMPLEDLFKAVAVNSANDAIVCLGEYICGSNDKFVEEMNKRAKELNMNGTHFANATGFDDENHYTTPKDMALLGCELLDYGEKILQYSSLKEAYIRENTDKPFWLVSTNKLLGHYDGLDGLKTGFTRKAGYNLTATAKRNGIRLVSTVMNLDTIAHRSQDTIRLLDYGFSSLKAINLYNANDIVSTFCIDRTLKKYLKVYVKENINVVLDREESKDEIKVDIKLTKINPPYKVNQEVGYIEVISPKGNVYKYPVYAYNNVEQISFFQYILNFFKSLLL